MLDEAHERTLYTDIAIGLLKKVMPTDTVFVDLGKKWMISDFNSLDFMWREKFRFQKNFK